MTAEAWRRRESYAELEHDHGWMVEVATRRVVRRRCRACEIEAQELARLEREAAEAGAACLRETLEEVPAAIVAQRLS